MNHKTPTFAFALRGVLFAAAISLFALPARPAAAQYTLTSLPVNFNAFALNNNGQVLGNIGGSLYLVTNRVSQLVTGINPNVGYRPPYFLNQKGQVAGVDSGGNVFLYTNGIMQTLTTKKYILDVVGLNDNGEIVWNAQDTYYLPNQVYTYQNGTIQNLGAHTALGVNNAGQIVSDKEFYSGGVWQTPLNYSGGIRINNNGQILYVAEQGGKDSLGFYFVVANIGVYTIATGSSNVVGSQAYSQYINPPYVVGFNDAGDFVGVYYGPGVSSSNQSAGFGYIHGQNKVFGSINIPPSSTNVNSGGVTALNNRGDVIWSTYHVNGPYADLLYDADTDSSKNVGQLLTGTTGGNPAYPYLLLVNDRKQVVVKAYTANSFTNYLATPNALLPADSVSGVVSLESEIAAAPAQTVTFEFRDAASNQTLFTRTANVSAYGDFILSGIPAGSYTLRVKSPKNLAQTVSVVKAGGALLGVSVVLPGGDADNNNVVDVGDFGLLLNAYNGDAGVPGSGYDARADFNGDGTVDIGDFGLLVNNYDLSGAL